MNTSEAIKAKLGIQKDIYLGVLKSKREITAIESGDSVV